MLQSQQVLLPQGPFYFCQQNHGGGLLPWAGKAPASYLHTAPGRGKISDSRHVTTGAATGLGLCCWLMLAHEWGLASAWGAAPQPQPAKCHLRALLSSVRACGLLNGREPPGTRAYSGGLLSPKTDLQLGGLCPSSHLPSAWFLPWPPDSTGPKSASCQLG